MTDIDGAAALRSASEQMRIGIATGPIPHPTRETVAVWLDRLAAETEARARRRATVELAPRRILTENEHSAAWHAIEGAADEEGADPGTVLNAVLSALGIDPPAAVQHEAAHPADCQCIPASPMAPRIYADCCLPAGAHHA